MMKNKIERQYKCKGKERQMRKRTAFYLVLGVVALGFVAGIVMEAQGERRGKEKKKTKKGSTVLTSEKKEKTTRKKKKRQRFVDVEELMEIKKIKGKIAGMSPLKNPMFIGVALEKENMDHYFVVGENMSVVNGRTEKPMETKDLKVGDAVKLTYHSIKVIRTRTDKSNEEQDVEEKTKRVAVLIRYEPEIKGVLESGGK